MNHILEAFARDYLTENLPKIPLDWQNKFKLLYARTGGEGISTTLKKSLEQIITTIPSDKLDLAMTQLEGSLKKLAAMK